MLTRDGLDGLAKMVSPTGNWAAERLSLSGALACPEAARQTAQDIRPASSPLR